jgi:hypothetical protein
LRYSFTDVSGQSIGPIFKGQNVLFFLDFMTLEDGTDALSRNFGKGLPHDAAKSVDLINIAAEALYSVTFSAHISTQKAVSVGEFGCYCSRSYDGIPVDSNTIASYKPVMVVPLMWMDTLIAVKTSGLV